MIMKILRDVFDQIVLQASSQLPNEACGYLLGNNDTITVNYPMTNADHSPEHFSFQPHEQFAAVKHARKNGLQIVANWHSHPSSPSRPSQEDIRLAFDPTIAYLILSLASDLPILNAFSIKNGVVEKLQLEIIEHK